MKKKWFFVILILVVIGIVLAIVFINLFKVRDTKELALKVNEVSQTGYLQPESDENQIIDKYLTSLSKNSDLADEEKKLIYNYAEAYAGFEDAIGFFDRHIIFVEASDTYQNYFKGIERALDEAQRAANDLATYISDNDEVVGDSQYWQASTWTDCERNVETLITNSMDALNNLAEIYMTSMPKVEDFGIWNNAFTDIVLTEMKALNLQIKQQARADETIGSKFKKFAKAYLSEKGESLILKYQYSENKDIVLDIKENGKDAKRYEDFIAGVLSF